MFNHSIEGCNITMQPFNTPFTQISKMLWWSLKWTLAAHQHFSALTVCYFIRTSALPVGNMYSYRKVGGYVAFSWMAKWGVWRWDIRDIIGCFWLLLIIPLYFTLKTIYLALFGVIIFSTTSHVWLYSYFFILTYYINTMDLKSQNNIKSE